MTDKSFRTFVYMNEKRFGVALAPDMKAWFKHNVECAGCYRVGKHWEPKPLDITVIGSVVGCGGTVSWAACSVVHHDLLEQLLPYNDQIVIGKCTPAQPAFHEPA